MRKTFLLLLLCVIFCGCTENVSEQTTVCESTAEVTTAAVTEELPVVMSPLAEADYLLPLEEYSWEREFPPEYVMLHFTSAVVLSKSAPYDIRAVRRIFEESYVSINYIIDRDGGIFCYIPESHAAWHAGKGEFANDGRLTNAMNKYSIGIELLAIGSERDMAQYLSEEEYAALDKSLIGYTDAQYAAASALVRDICERNEIVFDREHVIGHEMYNPQKSDPGELFDWERIFK